MADKREWTDEQSRAINTRDRTLLISAAAGSGKTATLTERIIRSLLDEENPENINEILIVTFTKAAVAELRERIGRAVRDALAENPESERLRRQLALLPSAKIQTIDSFCVDILRKNCDKVGVSPSFRVPDEAEARLLAITTMERLIDTVYDGLLREVASPEEFENLSDGLTDSRGMSELASVLLGIYDDLVDVEDGVDSLLPLAEQALRLGKRIAFPLCHPKTHKMTFHAVDTLGELTVGAYGIPEPDHHLPTVTANARTLCIVPALSFDRFGYRLVYGGGYYDRFLSEFAGISVGLVYEALCVEELPRDRYDERVDLIITEKGVNYQNERTQRSKEACDR